MTSSFSFFGELSGYDVIFNQVASTGKNLMERTQLKYCTNGGAGSQREGLGVFSKVEEQVWNINNPKIENK